MDLVSVAGAAFFISAWCLMGYMALRHWILKRHFEAREDHIEWKAGKAIQNGQQVTPMNRYQWSQEFDREAIAPPKRRSSSYEY